MDRVRLDKWLWAARFFKTRSLAKQAIEGGKVSLNGAKPKVSKEIEAGAELTLTIGWDKRVIHVLKLGDKRGPASVVQKMYQESEDSIQKREDYARERKLAGNAILHSPTKPSGKTRRQIDKLKKQILDPGNPE